MLNESAAFSRRLLAWFDRHQRELPWRASPRTGQPPSPYHVLVSELMLQQTQVATVIPYFHRFIERFPTLQSLADADEQEVLRLWQGLGYYSRARNLLKAARTVVERHAGRLPQSAEALAELPGIGRYTAGAVSSIAFDQRVPILDGNVTRVLCRLDKIESDPRDPSTQKILWRRAEAILPRKRCGDFNASLMELGALICIPRAPRCLLCPVQQHCEALAAGLTASIPLKKKGKQTPLVRRSTYCIRRGNQWLIEQRPPKGRWAGLWQFITRPADAPLDQLPSPVESPRKLTTVKHALTHRRYLFDVFTAIAKAPGPAPSASIRWTTLEKLGDYPLPRPHLKIADLLRDASK